MTTQTNPRRLGPRLHCGGVLSLVCAFLAPAASATTLVRMDLDELTRKAAVVARARCLANLSRWEGGHLWTLSTFEVTETWKGEAPRTITVRLLGGSDGRRTVHVDGVPRFRPGEEVALFLEPSGRGELTVTGWVQGTFRIRRDSRAGVEIVTQDTSDVSIWDPVSRKSYAGGVRQMSIEEFRGRILRAGRGARASQPQEQLP